MPRPPTWDPSKGAKSTTLEGGIRVPLIIRWPGHIQPGTISKQVCATFDLTRSFLKLVGARTAFLGLDGLDIIDHVVKQKPDLKRTLYWRGKRGERTWWAVRDGDLKYVRKTEGETDEWLYDLADDIGEEKDLSLSQPKDVARLKKLIVNWEKRVKAVR